MSQWEVLDGLHIGCVQYLNSRPLIHGLQGVRLAHPRLLADELRSGELDVALVPVFELLRAPQAYIAVDGVAIASEGPVYSVFVAHEHPLGALKGVVADPASLTSIHLFQVLSKGALGLDLPLLEGGDSAALGEHGQLWIGNQALAFRQKYAGEGMQFWDLGEAWTAWTGLPFVYAVWVLRRGLPEAERVAEAFRDVAKAAVASIPGIAAGEVDFGPGVALEYLTRNIRFAMGALEKAGLDRFRSELVARGFLPQSETGLDFV
ncbi:MAG: menaquinone biosynthesis protein [Verrucomicrobiota bacterium]